MVFDAVPNNPPRAMRRHCYWFSGLLAVEAVFSLMRLDDFAPLGVLASQLSRVFPVISNLGAVAKNPDLVMNYLALTLCLLPLKIWFVMLWFHYNRGETLSHIIATPFSPNRSWFARVLFLIGAGAIAYGIGWYVLSKFGDVSFTAKMSFTERRRLAAILRGGLPMWVAWTILSLVVAGFWGAFLATVRDWLTYFFGQKH